MGPARLANKIARLKAEIADLDAEWDSIDNDPYADERRKTISAKILLTSRQVVRLEAEIEDG